MEQNNQLQIITILALFSKKAHSLAEALTSHQKRALRSQSRGWQSLDSEYRSIVIEPRKAELSKFRSQLNRNNIRRWTICLKHYQQVKRMLPLWLNRRGGKPSWNWKSKRC